ncbi:MAG TPA: GNAT family N-acetyltransferase [Burkholderiaceae bacterium]|jgi:putative acetyltransferase|nr:GNAT family N-acetyltransferase [Burkholderiaceae bacterium]
MGTALDASRLFIRAVEPSDAPGMAALMNQPGVYDGLMQLPFAPVSRWQERLKTSDANGCFLVALDGERIVAQAALVPMHPSPRRSHVRGLGIAVAHDWQGHGVGARLLESLLHWADGWANVLRIELGVYADNVSAISLYKRFGFREEGLMRAYALRDGRFVDTLAMARLHPNPPTLPQLDAAG